MESEHENKSLEDFSRPHSTNRIVGCLNVRCYLCQSELYVIRCRKWEAEGNTRFHLAFVPFISQSRDRLEVMETSAAQHKMSSQCCSKVSSHSSPNVMLSRKWRDADCLTVPHLFMFLTIPYFPLM